MIELFHDLIELIRDPGVAIAYGGYFALALIVFLETGAMVFFLPGDSLLVTAGVYASKGVLNIFLLNLIVVFFAILGPMVSYWIGAKAGPKIFNRPRSRFFRPEHIQAAHAFYEKHGGVAIIIARFMPLVRTFVPVIAGVAQMPYRRYSMFNLIGALAWVLSMTLIGYFLGAAFPAVTKRMELVIIVVVALSLMPGFIAWLRSRRKGSGTIRQPD
jgi:membrane-associated protein